MAKEKSKTDNKFGWKLDDLKIIKKGKSKKTESKFLWVLEDLLVEVNPVAAKMGLKFAGWGKWKDINTGKITHKSQNGKIVPLDTPDEPKKEEPKGEQPSKPAPTPTLKQAESKFEKPTYHASDTDDEEWEEMEFNAKVKTPLAKEHYSSKFCKDSDFSKWAGDISSDQYHALRDYSGSGHGDINDSLRQNPENLKYWNEDKKQRIETKIKKIDAAFESAPRTKHPISVFRGIADSDIASKLSKIIREKLTEGSEFEDMGFVSTSALRYKAEGFGNLLVFAIRIPKGSKGVLPLNTERGGDEISTHHSELEMLLRRGSRFRVKKLITEESHGHGPRMRVELEYLGAPSQPKGAAPTAAKTQSAAGKAFAASDPEDKNLPKFGPGGKAAGETWQLPGTKQQVFYNTSGDVIDAKTSTIIQKAKKAFPDFIPIGQKGSANGKGAGEIWKYPDTGDDVFYNSKGDIVKSNTGEVIVKGGLKPPPSKKDEPEKKIVEPYSDQDAPKGSKMFGGLAGYKFDKALGGTQGSAIYISPTGKKWAVKGESYSGTKEWNESRVRAEKLANELYRRFDVIAPKSYVQATGNKPDTGGFALFTRYMENLEDVSAKNADQKKQVADGFAVDLLFGNRDVVGLETDNVKWDPETKKVIRLDNGAAFQFRAQGKEKPFDVETMWKEFQGLRDDSLNKSAAAFFGDLSDKDIAEQVQKKIKPVADDILTGIVDGSNIPDGERYKIVDGLLKRKKALEKWADDFLADPAAKKEVNEYFDQFRF